MKQLAYLIALKDCCWLNTILGYLASIFNVEWICTMMKIMGIFWTVGQEIFLIYSLSTQKRQEAILVCVIFDLIQRFSPIFCSRPLSCLTCLSLFHLARDGLSNPLNADWNRLLSWWSTGISHLSARDSVIMIRGYCCLGAQKRQTTLHARINSIFL